MKERVFLFKIKNSDDRDVCGYINNNAERFEYGYYFGNVILEGACYSGMNFPEYKDITTILTEEEYNHLINFNKELKKLGCGISENISENDSRYITGKRLCKAIQPIFDKLNSEAAENLFRQIQEEEKEYLMENYPCLNEEDIAIIWDNYYFEYRDRAIVGGIYSNAYELGYEEAWGLGYIDSNDYIVEKYFDFEAFGEDLVSDLEDYVELTSGKIAMLMY